MPIKLNGQTIESITLNGSAIDEVTVNGSTVHTPFAGPDAAVFQLDALALDLNNGDTVNTWQDIIGNNDATLRTGTPTYLSNGFNNKPTVDMAGGSDSFSFPEFLESQLSATSAEMAGVILLQNDQNTQADGFMHYSGDDSNEHLTWSNGSYYSELFNNNREKIDAPPGLTTGARFVWGVSSGSTWRSYFNNNLSYEETSNTVDFTPQGPILGTKRSGNYVGFGYVSEVVIYDRVLTNQERTDEFNRLESKWGPFDTMGIVPDNLVINLDASQSASYDGSGSTWFDTSGNNNDATLVGSPTYETGFGGYFNFDGSNDYFEGVHNSQTDLSSSAGTIEVVFRIDSNPGDWVSIFGKIASSSNRSYSLWYNVSSDSFLWQRYDGDSAGASFDPNISFNQWYHLVGVSDGSEHRIYLNGQLRDTDFASTTFDTSTDPYRVGYDGNNVHTEHHGDVALARMYSDALTDAEVLQNFNVTKNRYGL